MKRGGFLSFLNHVFTALLALVCVLPMILVLSISLSSDRSIKQSGYRLVPGEFSLDAYRLIFRGNSSVFQSYFISTSVTLLGTLLAALITSMAAFALVNRNVRYRNFLAFLFFIPMVFSGGLVPWYLMCRNLGLVNNFLALLVPSLLFSPFNMFLCRNFMRGIPGSFMESAKLDGARDFRIAFAIYFPLSTPVIATVALFYGIAYWNDWFNAIMLVNSQSLYPLQYMLMKVQSEIESLRRLQPGVPVRDLPGESLKMATCILTVGPISLLYPSLHKYVVIGLGMGGVKG
jgi:putative aldouronate transport system permease protein